jgi:hypothetical protein
MLFTVINTYSDIIWFSAILIGSLDIVIFIGSSKSSSRAFAYSILWVILWMICVSLYISASDTVTALILIKASYFTGSIISTSFFFFFNIYPENKKPTKLFSVTIVLIEAVLGYLILFSDKIISSTYKIGVPNNWGIVFGDFYILFDVIFFGFFIFGITFFI